MTKSEIMEIIQDHRDIPEISEVMEKIIQTFTESGTNFELSKIPESLYDDIVKLKKLLNLESESDNDILKVLKEIYRKENDN
jgi:HD-like signal output (HDOD) protein